MTAWEMCRLYRLPPPSSLNVKWGVPKRGGGGGGGWKGHSPLSILGLMRFIDHSDGPQTSIWHSGIMHTDGVWCTIAKIQSKFRGGPAWESVQSLLLGSRVVMNIINDIARGGWLFMCTCPTKSDPRGANAVGEEHLWAWHLLNVPQMCTFGERIQGLIHRPVRPLHLRHQDVPV